MYIMSILFSAIVYEVLYQYVFKMESALDKARDMMTTKPYKQCHDSQCSNLDTKDR